MRRYKPAKLSWPKDWLIKLISLFFAVFLWYFVAGEDRVDMNVRIPVEIINLPRDLVISNQFKDILEVSVSGPRSLIRDISRHDITRSIDLSNATPGNIIIDNKTNSIPFPRGITVLRIQPSHIILLLDKLIQKNIPIRYITKGLPAHGYKLTDIALNPDHLTISGPQTLISKEKDIPTRIINLNGLTTPETRQVSLEIPLAIANLIGEPSITAHINIQQQFVKKEVGKLSIDIRGLPDNLHAKLKAKIVKVRASIPLLTIERQTNLKKLFKASINAADLPPGSHELQVQLSAEPGILIEEIEPPKVILIIK